MRTHTKRLIGVLAAVVWIAALPATPASASAYRNWAQTPNNSAGVVFHPKGDYFEVWNNGKPGEDIYGVSIVFNYKGVDDKWKSAGEVKTFGRSLVHRNFSEKRHIYFYIVGPDNTVSTPVSEYRTNGS
jgi:hypothetical protein